MTTIAFDTLAFTEELTAAGVPEPQAKAQARAMVKIMESQELATKADLAMIQVDLVAMEERLRREMAESKAELTRWMVGMAGVIIAALKLLP